MVRLDKRGKWRLRQVTDPVKSLPCQIHVDHAKIVQSLHVARIFSQTKLVVVNRSVKFFEGDEAGPQLSTYLAVPGLKRRSTFEERHRITKPSLCVANAAQKVIGCIQ